MSTREALMVEAIGDVANLMQALEALAPALDSRCRELSQATVRLRDTLAAFEGRVSAITENAKTQTVQYLAARTEEAARRSIAQQSQAMADAARVAFGAEVGAAMQRWQAALQPLIVRRERRWEAWLTHAATVVVTAMLTWALALYAGRL